MKAVFCVCVLVPAVAATAQVRHPRPSATAKRVASHLPWQRSFDEALALAKKTKKHLLWYVPTVPGSPMDRKPVVDLYMRAGFFSDPDLEPLLREFVLLDRAPDSLRARKFDLLPFRYVEPGFLVLDPDGKVVVRAHSISTFSPRWFAQRLARLRKAKDALQPAGGSAAERAAHIRDQRLFGKPGLVEIPELDDADLARSAALAVQVALLHLGKGDVEAAALVLAKAKQGAPRVRFLQAACGFLSGRQTWARGRWKDLAKDHANEPIGWRAAAEAEGFGPFARGFWIWRELVPWRSDDPGTRVPATEQDVPLLRRRSVEFLLRMQDRDGGFEDSNYDFGGLDSLPNVYVAVTALCARALYENRSIDVDRCEDAVKRGLAYVLDQKNWNPRDRDEWIWAQVYTIDLLSELLRTDMFPKDKLKRALAKHVEQVFERQRRDGSFRHEYANPFATASLLLALDEARGHGVEPPADAMRAALASLERCRSRVGGFSYGQTARGIRARASVKGSAGRMPLCEAALFAWGKGSRARLDKALLAAFEHHDQLESTRKYDDHANSLAYGGFFFWYDMFGREEAMQRAGQDAAKWRAKQRKLILEIPEIDGCFVDSHELGRCYGTAMALLCLRGDGR